VKGGGGKEGIEEGEKGDMGREEKGGKERKGGRGKKEGDEKSGGGGAKVNVGENG